MVKHLVAVWPSTKHISGTNYFDVPMISESVSPSERHTRFHELDCQTSTDFASPFDAQALIDGDGAHVIDVTAAIDGSRCVGWPLALVTI